MFNQKFVDNVHNGLVRAQTEITYSQMFFMREGQAHLRNPYHKILFSCKGEQTADTHEWTLGF